MTKKSPAKSELPLEVKLEKAFNFRKLKVPSVVGGPLESIRVADYFNQNGERKTFVISYSHGADLANRD